MENSTPKKTILSGVTPSGRLTVGHLTGALSNWTAMQSEYDAYFMIADLHAITLRQKPADLRARTLDTAATFLACGIDPEESTIFIQSHIPAHAELAWVLNTYTGMGECSKMTQFKDKSAKNEANINVGLFTYPILMACDILLYQANLVPVGQDQKQHLELTRNLAQRFNHNYSPTFTIPEPHIPKLGAKIMSMQDPTMKMSKSDPNENSTIFLDDDDATIKRKVKRAVTDNDALVKMSAEAGKEGISNLITLYQISKGLPVKEIEAKFEGIGYGDFKEEVGNALAEYISPIREKYLGYRTDKSKLKEILTAGRDKANNKARKTLSKVYKKVGFVQF
jgi:tryptophanyl-tRNA synthetase